MVTTTERIQLNRKTAAQWTAANTVLLSGEAGVELDTGKVKFGNGTAGWTALPYSYAGAAGVTTVAGRSGDVTLTKTDVGLTAVDNTADSAKPVSTAQATALATKVTAPTGGVDGQAIVKAGTGWALATITGGGGSSSPDVYAPAPLGGTSKDDANIVATIAANPGKTVKLRPGSVYQINSLALPTNTILDLNGSELRQVNPTGTGGGGACVKNAGYAEDITANTDITVINGTISVSTAANARPVSFQGVTRLRLRDITITKLADATFADFMLSLNCVDDFTLDRVRITGGTLVGEDGIHIKASTRGVISNVIVDAGDDALVFVHQFAAKRVTKQITVTNAVLRSNVAHIIRIGVYAGETFPISDITLTGIVGDVAPGSTSEGLKFHDDTNTGLVRDIVWAGGVIDLANQTSTNAGIYLKQVTRCSFAGVRVVNANGRVWNLDGCTDLTFTDCHGRQRTGAPGNSIWVATSSARLTFTSCAATTSSQHGFYVATGTGSADISFDQCKVQSVTSAGIRLNDVTGVRVTNSLIGGGNGGIVCDTTTPPAGILLVANRVTTGTGTTLTSAPAGTRAVANTGITDQ